MNRERGDRRPCRVCGYLVQLLECALVLVPVLCLLLFNFPRRQARTDDHRLRILVGLLPPYVNEQGRGREVEIITRALSEGFRSSELEFFVQPFSRHWSSFQADERFDAVATVPDSIEIAGYKSCVYIQYQNGIGFRKEQFKRGDQLVRPSLNMLHGRRVAAFAGAAGILGLPHDKYILYIERKDQEVLSFLLQNQVDAVIEDEMIFREYNRGLSPAQQRELDFERAFDPTPYHMVFRRLEDKEAFDRGIKRLRPGGQLALINPGFFDNRPLGLDPARDIPECP